MTNFYCTCECDPFDFWDITANEYLKLSYQKRMAFLRSLRLFLIEQKRKEKRDQKFKKRLFDLWIRGAKT